MLLWEGDPEMRIPIARITEVHSYLGVGKGFVQFYRLTVFHNDNHGLIYERFTGYCLQFQARYVSMDQTT